MARTKPAWLRSTTIGTELFAAVVGAALFGFWIDKTYGTGPRGLLICSILGLVGGLYNFIRTSLRILNPPGPSQPGVQSGEGPPKESEDKESEDTGSENGHER